MTASSKLFFAKDTVIEKSTTLRQFSSVDEVPLHSSTDHMVEIDYTVADGWSVPHIKPYAMLALDPTASCLHYATQCFEGMKVFRSKDGKTLRLIRPILNLERLNTSCARACLPTFDPAELLEILKKFVALDARYVAPGKFAYLRPYVIGTNAGLGVKAPTSAKLGIVMTMLPVLSEDPLKLYCSRGGAVRAWPGGFGSAKLGANYGPTMQLGAEAVSKGYHQVLWLYNRIVTEAGSSNFVIVWDSPTDKDASGKPVIEVVTCDLDTGLILPGINRRNALEYLRETYDKEHGGDGSLRIIEKAFTIDDVLQSQKEGRLREAFAIGTALFVSPIQEILTPEDVDIKIPVVENGVAQSLIDLFSNHMYGNNNEPHPWVVEIKEA